MRALFDRLTEVRDAFHGHQMMDVRDQHDPIARRDPEERDETDHRRDTQDATRQEHAGNAADERQRQVEHDEQRITGCAKRQNQKHE